MGRKNYLKAGITPTKLLTLSFDKISIDFDHSMLLNCKLQRLGKKNREFDTFNEMNWHF